MSDCCSSLQVMRINADLEKLEKRVTDMEKNHFIQINVSGTSIHIFFWGGVWCWQDEYILYSVFKLVSFIIIIHFSGYHPLSGGGRADKARDPAESHHCLWDPVGIRTTLCLQPTEEQCKERQTYLWLYHCGWSKALLSLSSFG